MGISASIVVMTPLVYADAGDGTCLAFAIATVTYILVAIQVNVFAGRIATPGSLHTFVTEALGPRAGSVAGWMLLLGYVSFLPAYFVGIPYYAIAGLRGMFGESTGILVPTAPDMAVLGGLVAAAGGWISLRDIRVSTRAIMAVEFVTLGMIAAMAARYFLGAGIHADALQFQPVDVGARPFGSGLILAMSCFFGFEACSVLGVEAKSPLTMIPRANMMTVILTGTAIVAFSYAVVQAFHAHGLNMAEADHPVMVFADMLGLGSVVPAILGGVAISGFGCILGTLNTGGRLLYSLSRQCSFLGFATLTHQRHRTPYVASAVLAAVGLAATLLMLANDLRVPDIIGSCATFGAFGFMTAYVMCSVGATVHLLRHGTP